REALPRRGGAHSHCPHRRASSPRNARKPRCSLIRHQGSGDPGIRSGRMESSAGGSRRIAWQNLLTVISAAILIGAEVFGAAFAGGWAVANLFDFGPYGVHIMQGLFFLCGLAVMFAFIRNAQRVEPFTKRG